ncbi:hypothetical protein [Chengkuizengella axinellae]|uniref:Uncharacterized protein n=1 Tax=Chengkuizengella axinellae TaxID=3064388 RepID=A0ABT9IXE2_9BACL|nr:hypothetical protein [Chengkuizengella sp. 2205SS18-9]MDP5273465.1 hypothetical protein [Chengkuizengella sp. 2205SS18-9]
MLLFVISFAIRWIITMILKSNADQSSNKGSYLDMTTPTDTDEINESLKDNYTASKGQQLQENQNDFKPIQAPKLKTNDNNIDPKEVAEAVKHLSNE